MNGQLMIRSTAVKSSSTTTVHQTVGPHPTALSNPALTQKLSFQDWLYQIDYVSFGLYLASMILSILGPAVQALSFFGQISGYLNVLKLGTFALSAGTEVGALITGVFQDNFASVAFALVGITKAFFFDVLGKLSWWQGILFGVAVAADGVGDTLSAGTALAIELALDVQISVVFWATSYAEWIHSSYA